MNYIATAYEKHVSRDSIIKGRIYNSLKAV